MNDYWYLCFDDGVIKYAGQFWGFDECDEYIKTIPAHAVWIFTGMPKIESK